MKSNLLLVALLILFFFPSIIYAQTNYEDVVYLKNGNVIHGMIIEQIPDQSIKIKSDNNIFLFKIDEVLKITKEEVPPTVNPASTEGPGKKEAARKKCGYINFTESSFATSIRKTHSTTTEFGKTLTYDSHLDLINNSPHFTMQTINGYLFNPHFSAGVGIGLQSSFVSAFIPLFADVRYNFTERKVTPFAVADLGYSFAYNVPRGYHDKAGLMGTLGAGIKFFCIPQMALNLSVDYRYQELTTVDGYEEINGHITAIRPHTSLNQLVLRIGLSF